MIAEVLRNQFREKHGDSVVIGGWVLFADGARMERDWGRTEDPPSDPVERAKRKVQFCKAKLEIAVKNFDRVKDVLEAVGEPIAPRVNGVDVGPDPIRTLTELKDVAVVWANRLKTAEDELAAFYPNKERNALWEQARIEKQNAFKSAVEKITI